MRFQTRISMALLAVALVPLTGAMLLALDHNSREAHRLNIQLIENLTRASAAQLSGYFQERKQEMAAYAAMPSIRAMQFSKVDQYLKHELGRHGGRYEKFIVGDLNGYFHNTAGGNAFQQGYRSFNDRDPKAKLKSIKQRDYWLTTVGSNTDAEPVVYVSEPMISYTTGVRQIVVAASIYDLNNKLAGMIGGALPWDEIQLRAQQAHELIQNGFHRDAKVSLVSREGVYIYHWQADKIIQLRRDPAGEFAINDIGERTIVKHRVLDSEIAAVRRAGEAMFAEESGHIHYVEPDSQEEMMMVYAPVAATGYAISAIFPENLIHAPTIRLRNFFFLVLLAAIVIVVLISLVVSRKIAKPVIKLTKGAREVAKGNYHLDVEVTGSAEMKELSDAFNSMNEAIARREDLLVQSRQELEQRVSERTQQLSEAKDNAELANKSKSQFLANMSHELRSPISGVIGTLDLLEKTQLDGAQEKYLCAARSSGKHLLHLINDILDFSKYESGNMMLEPTDFSLAQFMEDLHSANQASAAGKSVTLNFVIDREISSYIHADRLCLWQVLMNLIGNAIKFTEHGAIQIKASKRSERAGVMMLQFDVIDTGIGIEPELIESIFDAFKQGEMQANRRYAGTGLGLALCRRMVNLMQGELTVISEPGQGSHFSFSMECGVAAVPTAVRDGQAKTGTLRGTVLLAEDNPVNQMVIEGILNSIGLSVEIAHNGEECVQHWQQGSYDLILMDMQMPVMDGIEATRTIRRAEREQSHIPIIALTANVYRQDQEACLAAGMDGFLGKPLNTEKLQQTLHKWLKHGS